VWQHICKEMVFWYIEIKCTVNPQKYWNIKFHEDPSRDSQASFKRTGRQTERRTERHDESDIRFSQFCELAWKQVWLDWRMLEWRSHDLLLLPYFNSGLYPSTSFENCECANQLSSRSGHFNTSRCLLAFTRALALNICIFFIQYTYMCIYMILRRLRWSSGSHAGLWFPSSRVQTRYFLCKKILSIPSSGGEVK
jgi:hypothetical protein